MIQVIGNRIEREGPARLAHFGIVHRRILRRCADAMVALKGETLARGPKFIYYRGVL